MSRVAKRYAKALFELAVEEKQLPRVSDDLKLIGNLIATNEDFERFIMDPLLGGEARVRLVKEIFKGKVAQLTMNFLELIADKKRLLQLEMIIAHFNKFLLAHNNQIEGELISAVELQQKQVDQIRQKVQKAAGKEVLLKQTLVPEVLGGFIVKVGDMVIDNSIRFQLEKLRERLKTR